MKFIFCSSLSRHDETLSPISDFFSSILSHLVPKLFVHWCMFQHFNLQIYCFIFIDNESKRAFIMDMKKLIVWTWAGNVKGMSFYENKLNATLIAKRRISDTKCVVDTLCQFSYNHCLAREDITSDTCALWKLWMIEIFLLRA